MHFIQPGHNITIYCRANQRQVQQTVYNYILSIFNRMDWLSRKLVLWQIKKYFHLENEQQIQVQLLGEHSLTCKNLKLRNSVVNVPTAKIHIQQLTITSLSINYKNTGEEPLKLSLDGAKLVLAFNPNYVEPPPSYANTKEQLKNFFEALKSKEALQHRGFFSQEIFQIKKLVMQFFVKKVSLLIRNVDISIQYANQGQIHALGCQLGEVNIKQRMVINHQDNNFKQSKQQEIICTLEAVSIYLGISSEEDKIEELAYNRQILRKTKTIKKNYVLDNQKIQIYYNLNKNSMTVFLQKLDFKVNKLLFIQLLKISKYLQEHLSSRPIYRPGKGQQKTIEMKGVVNRVHEGTRQWWIYAFTRIVEKVQEKKRFNILTNFKYRLYLFYLIYRYTYGSNTHIDKFISQYQQKKLSHSIMSAYSMVLTRIDAIRNSDEIQEEIMYFFNFICSSKMIIDVCNKHSLKKVTIEKIKSSKIYFNLGNCNEYIRDFTSKSNISITVTIEQSIKAEFHQSKYDKILLKDGFNLQPANFYHLKNKYITKFYKKMTEESIKWEIPFLSLELNHFQFFKNKNQVKLSIPSITLVAQEKSVVLKISNIMLFKENKTLYTNQNKIIVSEKNNLIKVTSILFNLHKGLVEHLLTINALLNENAIEPLSEQEEFQSYIQENIYKRLPKHPIFQSFSDQSTHIEIQKMFIITSVFEQNQYLAIDINSVQYGSSNQNSPPRISLQKISVTRSRLPNLQKMKHKKIQRLTVENESVIMQNNKPLALTSNKYIRRYNDFIYYESVLDILIPFILIQISFQDVYYLQLTLNYWSELFKSQYFFPKRQGKTQSEMRVIELKQQKIEYFEKLDEFTKSSRTRVKLEGIEFILFGQNKRLPNNEVLTMLVQGILYQNKVQILNMDTTLTIFNIFIQNCLGRKIFNHLKLAQIIEKKPQTKQPLIYDHKYVSQGGNLILYGLNQTMGHSQKKEDNNMIKVKIKNFFSIKKFKKNSNIIVMVKPIFFYHSPDYYKILVNSFGLISKTANKHFKPSLPGTKALVKQSDHEILEAKNISQKLILVCQIQKINLIALHQNQPIYTFSFLNVVVKHQTEAYVSKYQITSHQLYIVDISLNCGLHPIVLKAEPLQCFFTKYQSELLKRKQKKSALLKIILVNSELFFLNRKIKELTNFIMSHFQQVESDQPSQKQVKLQKKQQESIKSYPFCYKVQFIKPVIILLRSSLSAQKMISEAETLFIANYHQTPNEFRYNHQAQFFYNQSKQHLNNQSFQSCLQIKQQQIQFHSFAKAEQELDQNPHSKLHINLINFYVYNYNQQHNNAVIFTPQIVITLIQKDLTASLKLMNINFTADDYRLLIRITEENFSEIPVSYPKESIQTQEKMVGFRSKYTIEELNMTLRETVQSQKFGQLVLTNIIGVNTLFTNGEKQDEITVEKMEYQSCINHNLEKIITKKEQSEFVLFQFNQEMGGPKKFTGVNQFLKKYENLNQEDIHSNKQEQFFENGQKFGFSQGEQKQTVNRGNQQEHHKEETNLNRLGKWIGGMCRKCMCCCKTQAHTQEEVDSKKNLKNTENLQKHEQQQRKQFFNENQINLQESIIQNHNQIINFSAKVNPEDYRSKQKQSNCVYLHIKGQRSRQKRLYMLVQHLNIYYEKNQQIMALSNFLGRPYAEPQRPPYLKQAKFNNYRPFQQLYEVANTSIFLIQKQAIIQRSIELNTHVLFNMERIGDPITGPGKKLMESDVTFKMFFNDNKTAKRTSLSNIIRLIYSKQSHVTYHNRKPIKNNEKLLLIGLDSQIVHFNFPIYIIKSLVDLGKSLGSKGKKQQKGIQQKTSRVNIRLQQQNEIRNTQLRIQKQKSSRSKQKQKQPQKPKKPEPIPLNSSTIKLYFIPKIQISIQTKQTVSFINMYLQSTHLKNKQLSQLTSHMKNQTIDFDAYIEYWNLNLGKFQPFLQRCKFIVDQRSLKNENMENTKLKIVTKSQKDKNSFDYRNGLCLNLSTALFHTYKQLQLKYLLQNEKLQLSNQICYDLTKKDTDVYEYMQNKKPIQKDSYESQAFVKKFPQGLKNFFGRQFKLEDLNELNKKKSKRTTLLKNRFHIEGLKVFLHHSYLESKSKLKYITYRTPFRVFNVTPFRLLLKFKVNNRMARGQRWMHQILSKDYYAIPQDIYHFDFLVNIIARRKPAKPEISSQQFLHANQIMIEEEQQKTMSVKYLIQMHANKNQYHELNRHKLSEYIFGISTLQKRLIDKRDIVIRSNKLTLCLISVKSECQQYKDKTIDNAKVMLYDSLTIVISPIIIFNYTSQNFNITNCKKKKYQLLPSKSIELNEFPSELDIQDVVIQFLQDPVHHEYRLLNRSIGMHIQTMLIDRMQSVNIKTIKQTYNTCLVEIYPDWITINETMLEFDLFYGNKEFSINQQTKNSLAIQNWKDQQNKMMKIKLTDQFNEDGNYRKFATDTNLIDMFMLSKIQNNQKIKLIKKQIRQKKCCGYVNSEKFSDPEKAGDQRVFKCIQFVITIQQSPNYILTKNLTIDYKYWIVNQMDFEMIIYQSSFDSFKNQGQEQRGVEILRLAPKQQNYLYTYDFLAKHFFLKIQYQGQYIESNDFLCNQQIGRSLSVKLKKSSKIDIMHSNLAYHESFHHVRIDLEQVKYKNILTFSYIDDERTKYPYYINNTTNYSVKITQNGQSFKIRAKSKIPFSWSDLINNTHKIQVEIEGQSMIYSLKDKEYQFKPIEIKGQNFINKSSGVNKKLFKKEKCYVKWKEYSGEYYVIFDIFAKKLEINGIQSFTLLLSNAQNTVKYSTRIEILFKDRQIFQFHPCRQTIKEWGDLLKSNLNTNIVDKIYFTTQSFQNSMIYFIHNLQINQDNDVKIDHQQFIIENFFLSIINSNPLRIQQILLINMQNIEIIIENRLSSTKQEEKDSYLVKKIEETVKIGKLKINNQLRHALNPVVVSQIKKSNYPFLEIKRKKQNLLLWQDRNKSNQGGIQHYKSSIFFLDEAELIIEAALIPQVLNFRDALDQIKNQYSYQRDKVEEIDKKKKKITNNQVYIDYLQIKPIKMTISVSFDANIDSKFQTSLINFLTLIPSGVQNAIITIDSFVFHHVFMEQKNLQQKLREYYMYEMKKQVLFNAGSIQILTPFQLIKGLGIGFTNIFYNPIYELVSTKEIKSFTSNMLQGFITFILFILSLGFSVVNGIFKFLAMLTKDNNFQTKRETFRKQIFKSPMSGFSHGAKALVRIFKEFFINFITWPCVFNSKIPFFGLIIGFILSILYIIPWILKMIITLYDFFYVIGLGFISWGYYQQNSMKYRSRPIRTFPHKQLLPYDYLTSKGNQIMRKNLIQQNDNEQISFISHIESGDESKYLLLSNYRILYCSHQLTSFKQITLYKISKIVVGSVKKKEGSWEMEDLFVTVVLTFPDKTKCLCFECTSTDYQIKFKDLKSMKQFLQKLRQNLQKESIDFNLQDSTLKKYEKSLKPSSTIKNQKSQFRQIF